MKKPRKSWAERRLAQGKVGLIVKNQEHLVGCAIIRDGITHFGTFRTHSDVRRSLGDVAHYTETPGDECGYWTSKDRFVGRIEASTIAALAGQVSHRQSGTELLSCDVTWRTKA